MKGLQNAIATACELLQRNPYVRSVYAHVSVKRKTGTFVCQLPASAMFVLSSFHTQPVVSLVKPEFKSSLQGQLPHAKGGCASRICLHGAAFGPAQTQTGGPQPDVDWPALTVAC